MEEADLMKKFSHPNIVSLLGNKHITSSLSFPSIDIYLLFPMFINAGFSSNSEDDDEESAPLMILEYMPYGDLQGFLESHKYV